MLPCAFVVCSVLSVAFAEVYPVLNHNHLNVNASEDSGPRVQGVCYYGRVPSARCMFRCFMKGSTAYCNEAQCLCRSDDHLSAEVDHSQSFDEPDAANAHVHEQGEEVVKTNETEMETAPHRISFFILDLSRLFGRHDNSTEVNRTEKNSTEVMHVVPEDDPVEPLWTPTHLLAGVILLLLVVLVVVEVVHCCRPRKRHFQTVLTPPVLDKVYVSNK